jgi:hypothetical protein
VTRVASRLIFFFNGQLYFIAPSYDSHPANMEVGATPQEKNNFIEKFYLIYKKRLSRS